jgi:maltose alpha-D-glucosyltransferase/alpha-amylase
MSSGPPEMSDNSPLHEAIRLALALDGPRWLETQRWFAGKGRSITAVTTEDIWTEEVKDSIVALTVARVDFEDGSPDLYFLPLCVVDAASENEAISALPLAGAVAMLADAALVPFFGPWLLAALSSKSAGARGSWRFEARPGTEQVLVAASGCPAAPVNAEQSNTSLRFDDLAIVKLVRRLQPGPNPDEEILRGLSDVGFDRVPELLGTASWISADAINVPILLAQAFVPNSGDGWSWLLNRLALLLNNADPKAVDLTPERMLGRRTAEMHLAMSEIPGADFAPELSTTESVMFEIARTSDALQAVIAMIKEQHHRLPASIQEHLPSIISALQLRGSSLEGFRDEAGLPRIRAHGDYHLGQTLRTLDGDWIIIDFEGEPARPVAERRQKTSALKDVAGMLRSFSYARGVAERSRDGPMPAGVRARMANWEERARFAFIESYRQTIATGRIELVPRDEANFARALEAWELDKAIYEIAYEARNRPSWIDIPLRSLVPSFEAYPRDGTEAAPA